jgi:uncharacterized membrane protein YgcG
LKPETIYNFLQVGPKTQEVVDFHNDDSRPGKPLRIIVPGALIALASLGAIIYVVYQTWLKEILPENQAIKYLLMLAPVYIIGVFLFSYGMEMFNLAKSLKLTAIIVFTTVFIVVVIAVLFLLASAKAKVNSSSGSSSKSSSSKAASSGSGGGIGHWPRNTLLTGAVVGSGAEEKLAAEAAPAPIPIVCPGCQHSYVPAEQGVTCPNCGMARA